MVPISEKMAPFAEWRVLSTDEGVYPQKKGLSSEEGFHPRKKGSILGRRFYPQKKGSILVGLSPILSLWGVVAMRWQSYENLRINSSIFTIFFASKTSAWVEVTP